MNPETPKGETQGTTDPKTNANPTVPTVDPNEVERLRKEAEQATMRANQLANQLKAKEDAEAEARAKELEKQNEFKTLYEQERAKREAIEAEAAAKEKTALAKAETERLFGEYPAEVKAIAEKTGLTLSDTDEATVAAFKAKLDDLQSVIPKSKVTANNPGTPYTPPKPDLDPEQMRAMINNPAKFEEYLRKNTTGIAAMLNKKGE